jgi:hypothetical protein
VNKHGIIIDRPISGEAVRQTLKARLTEVGYDRAPFSAHSLETAMLPDLILVLHRGHLADEYDEFDQAYGFGRWAHGSDPHANYVLQPRPSRTIP